MNTVCVNKKKKFLEAVTKLKLMRGQQSGCSENVKEMVLLLLSYFDEKEDAMFSYVEDTCLAGEVQVNQVHLTPTIVVRGELIFFLSFSYFLFLVSLPLLYLVTNLCHIVCYCKLFKVKVALIGLTLMFHKSAHTLLS